MKYLTLIITITIIIIVLLPGSQVPSVDFVGFDKFVHISMFAAWAISLQFDFRSLRPITIVIVGVLFSFLTEVVQLFTEGRSFDLYDMIADGIGLAVGLLLARPIISMLDKIFKTRS